MERKAIDVHRDWRDKIAKRGNLADIPAKIRDIDDTYRRNLQKIELREKIRE